MMAVGAAYRIAADQSAGRASGHVAAAPPSSVMNSRRFTAGCLSVLPSVGIAHLGTADSCIHPLGRYETIADTPPIIFSIYLDETNIQKTHSKHIKFDS